MNARRLAGSLTLLLLPLALRAQMVVHDGSIAHHSPHLYAAADFGIEPTSVTFSKDIAPILQRSCQNCHHVGGGAPMPLETYQQVRRYASRIKERTAIRDRMGAMPPFFLEKDIGIQEFKNDPSLSDQELAQDPGVGGQRGARGQPGGHAGAARRFRTTWGGSSASPTSCSGRRT